MKKNTIHHIHYAKVLLLNFNSQSLKSIIWQVFTATGNIKSAILQLRCIHHCMFPVHLKLMAVSIKIWAWKFRITENSKFGNEIFEIFYRWFTVDIRKECTGYVIRYSSTNSIQIRYVISFEGAREIIMTHKLFLNSPHVHLLQFNYQKIIIIFSFSFIPNCMENGWLPTGSNSELGRALWINSNTSTGWYIRYSWLRNRYFSPVHVRYLSGPVQVVLMDHVLNNQSAKGQQCFEMKIWSGNPFQ